LGCKKAINYKKYQSKGEFNHNLFGEHLKKMMDGEGADIFYDNVGEDMLSSMLNVMA
jgi:NADPH:quinone reductase-like Zn-dependent oxidoreductase